MVCGLSVEEYRGGPRAKEMETERGWSLNEAYHWFGSATPFLLLKKEIVGWARVCHQGYHSKLLVLLVTILIEASKSIIDRTWSTIATFFGRISHFLVQSMQYASVYLFGLFCRLLLPLLLLLLAVLCDFVRRFLTSSLVSGVVTPRDRSENVLRGFYCFFFVVALCRLCRYCVLVLCGSWLLSLCPGGGNTRKYRQDTGQCRRSQEEAQRYSISAANGWKYVARPFICYF